MLHAQVHTEMVQALIMAACIQAEQWAHACGEDKAVVLEVVEKQFQANYHQAWAASYVLDPLYLVPGSTSDRWVPPFEKLSPQQRADAETIIKRLAPTDALRPQVRSRSCWRFCCLDGLPAGEDHQGGLLFAAGRWRTIQL